MGAHTPGPWEVTGAGPGLGVVATEHKFAPYWIASAVDNNNNPENEANARLIAAAPELLEALQEFSREYDGFLDGDGNPCPTLAKARAAISKATREAS